MRLLPSPTRAALGFICLCFLPACPSALAQTATAEVSSRETAITFSTGVNLVPVKVVVRGKDGRSVGNLMQADFELMDNGKSQTILRFSADTAEQLTARVSAVQTDVAGRERPDLQLPTQKPDAVIPERFIVYLFDDVHTQVSSLIRAREAATKQMERVLDPSTRVAVYTISGTTKLDFTDDLVAVRKTIEGIRRFSADEPMDECPSIDYYWADLIVNRDDAEATAVAINEVETCLQIPADTAPQMVRSMSYAVLAKGQYQSRMALRTVDDTIRRLTAMPGNRSLIYVSDGFFLDPELRINEGYLFERAIRAGVILNALDARGLFTIIPGGDASTPTARVSTPQSVTFKARLEREKAFANTDIMAEMANATGGRFFHNDNGYEQGYELLAGSPEYTYVLGFSPSDLKSDGKFHTLKVRLKTASLKNAAVANSAPKDWEVFARKGYYAPSAAADAAETVREEVRDAVFSREEKTGLPLDLNLQYFKTGDTEARLTVIAKLDMSTLKFRKAAFTPTTDGAAATTTPAASAIVAGNSGDIRNNDIVTVISVVFDHNGNFVKGVQRVVDMKLRDQTLEQLVAQGGIAVRTTIDLEPGSYIVRLVVRDAEGKTMATRNGSVEIPY